MNNIQFLREQAGLTQKQLSEMTGLSFGIISKYERESRGYERLSPKALERFSSALAATKRFIEGKSDSGIAITKDENAGDVYLISRIEYIHQKNLGNIEEKIMQPLPPYTQSEIDNLKKEFSIEQIKEMNFARTRPHIFRFVVNPNAGLEKDRKAMIKRINTNLDRMDEEQLRKALIVIEEVIMK